MILEKIKIEGPLILKPKIHNDSRGFFFETFRQDMIDGFVKNKVSFCQTNCSESKYGVFRGLHFQVYPYAQSKLVSVVKGEIIDFIIDLRPKSKTYGKSFNITLNDLNNFQLFIPKGFAHGFLVVSEVARIIYHVDNFYSPEHDVGINCLDPNLGLKLSTYNVDLKLSDKDLHLPSLEDCSQFKF